MVLNYAYVPRSYRGGAMTMPSSFSDHLARSVPVSQHYAPIVPAVAEAAQAPIPVTKQAAEEIEESNPMGKIVSFVSGLAGQSAAAATSPNFNTLMGALVQYLVNSRPAQPPP